MIVFILAICMKITIASIKLKYLNIVLMEHILTYFLNEKEINDYLRRAIDVNTWTVDSDDIKDFFSDEGVKTIITTKIS